MLRLALLGMIVAVTLFVFLRLIVLSVTKPARRQENVAPTIEAKPRFNSVMTVRKFEFKRFDVETGPADPENFREALTMHAAPEGTDEIAIYQLTVATPRAINQMLASDAGYSFQRSLLLVPRYDRALIERALHEHINEIVYLSGEGS